MPNTLSGPRAVMLLLAAAVVVLLQLSGNLGSTTKGTLHLSKAQVQRHMPGLVMVSAGVRRKGQRAGRLVAFFADPKVVDVGLMLNEPRAALRKIAEDRDVVVNAGYFTEQFRPTGLLVNAGQTLSRFVSSAGAAGSGVLVLQDQTVSLLDRDRVGERSFEEAEIAIQAGPRIIEVGGRPGIHSDDGARANRTIVGADQRGHLALVVIHNADGGRAAGPTLYELMSLLGPSGLGTVEEELALDFALNLDGGPSTGISVRPDPLSLELSERHPVLSVITLKVPC